MSRLVREIQTKLVGTQKTNDDGVYRRELIELINPGDKLEAHWDRETCGDATLILVESDSGIVGELSKGTIKGLFDEISTNCFITAQVSDISADKVVSVRVLVHQIEEGDCEAPTIDSEIYELNAEQKRLRDEIAMAEANLERLRKVQEAEKANSSAKFLVSNAKFIIRLLFAIVMLGLIVYMLVSCWLR